MTNVSAKDQEHARISWANDRDRLSLDRSLQTGLYARILVTCIKKVRISNVLDARKVIWKQFRLTSNTWCRTCKRAVLRPTVRGSRLERRAEEANWSQLAIRWNWVSNNLYVYQHNFFQYHLLYSYTTHEAMLLLSSNNTCYKLARKTRKQKQKTDKSAESSKGDSHNCGMHTSRR